MDYQSIGCVSSYARAGHGLRSKRSAERSLQKNAILFLYTMKNFHYVYLLSSTLDSSRHYTGTTDDLKARIKAHNAGQVSYTAKYRPWLLNTAIAFRRHEKALEFEKYLKTHSGRAFAKRHF